ncbi:hypothetical protein VTJ83DRAFT_938 [Remersonia thermophila]|uniref:C2H2-type domain-containing protein n=1 Tax=Remersonia thermophila TaxID=72144 RepID=A0ABR4DMP6_9PEZI
MTVTTATAAVNFGQSSVDASVYDPDEAFPGASPPLRPLRPNLQPSPSPPPSSSSSSSSSSPASRRGGKGGTRRRRPRPSQGDVLLISYLDGHRHAQDAFFGPSASEDEGPDVDPDMREDSCSETLDGQWEAGHEPRDASAQPNTSEPATTTTTTTGMAATSRQDDDDSGGIGDSVLKSLAAGALAAVRVSDTAAAATAAVAARPDPGPTSPAAEHAVSARPRLAPAPTIAVLHARRPEPLAAERQMPPTQPSMPSPSPYTPRSFRSPPEPAATPSSFRADPRSPNASLRSGSHGGEGLPPISGSPPAGGQTTLPSIREHLGDIDIRPPGHGPAAGCSGMRGSHPAFSASSPPPAMARLPSLQSQLGSPPPPPLPMPSTDAYRDGPPPGHPLASPATSPGFYHRPPNGLRRPPEFGSTSSETSSVRPSSASPPASALDRMNLDGIANSAAGNYRCTFLGCSAAPFHTQYLLNSHLKVHSSERPHYCPVPGCPRGEGGKGFKRKNEMIRHGLVHESPGYVCPFCPERDHKYPRPDNLQRHVRAHHPEKGKDDPDLREVLSQRPGGSNRGRRRRGGTS